MICGPVTSFYSAWVFFFFLLRHVPLIVQARRCASRRARGDPHADRRAQRCVDRCLCLCGLASLCPPPFSLSCHAALVWADGNAAAAWRDEAISTPRHASLTAAMCAVCDAQIAGSSRGGGHARAASSRISRSGSSSEARERRHDHPSQLRQQPLNSHEPRTKRGGTTASRSPPPKHGGAAARGDTPRRRVRPSRLLIHRGCIPDPRLIHHGIMRQRDGSRRGAAAGR